MKERNGTLSQARLMSNIVAVEQFLESLRMDFERAEFRTNELVRGNLEHGLKEVEKAVSAFAVDNIEEAERSTNLAWLRGYFARSIFDAEVTEHYLGESDFLELGEDIDDWQAFVKGELLALEEEIVQLRGEISSASGGKKAP